MSQVVFPEVGFYFPKGHEHVSKKKFVYIQDDGTLEVLDPKADHFTTRSIATHLKIKEKVAELTPLGVKNTGEYWRHFILRLRSFNLVELAAKLSASDRSPDTEPLTYGHLKWINQVLQEFQQNKIELDLKTVQIEDRDFQSRHLAFHSPVADHSKTHFSFHSPVADPSKTHFPDDEKAGKHFSIHSPHGSHPKDEFKTIEKDFNPSPDGPT